MSGTETLKQVEKAGRERLRPSLTNPNWLVLRKRRKLFLDWLSNISADGLSVLDIGGRVQPYRALLGKKCRRYVAVDLRRSPLVNVVGQAERLPFAEDKFDLVFCTQVLEYVPDPQAVLDEIHRTLKKGGFLLLSAPAVFPRDSETEYWRFLPGALKQLLSGFGQIELAPEGNSVIGFIRTTNVCLVSLARPRAFGSLLRLSVVPLLNLLGALVQPLTSSTDDRFSANFSVLAQK